MPDITTTFDTDEPLAAIEVDVTGPETATLTEADFEETDNGDGTYSYDGTYTCETDGEYTTTLNTAADGDGNDGASGQSGTVEVDTTAPVVTNYTVALTS